MTNIYKFESAKEYWENRIISDVASLNAVLYYSESILLNQYYDIWEKEVIGEFLQDLHKKRVLDAPVGNGRWTKDLYNKGADIYCVDISQEIINKAEQNMGNYTEDRIQYFVSDINNLPFRDGFFDSIICTGLFEHLPENEYLFATDKLAKMLSPNGKLVLVVNNKNNMALSQKQDNQFRQSRQLDNGYYCGLTDIDKVEAVLQKNQVRILKYATNPYFSSLRQISKGIDISGDVEAALFRSAVQRDINLHSNLAQHIDTSADQIIIMGEKYE